MHEFCTECPYNLNFAILRNTHAMTTQTIALGDSYLLVVQHRARQRLLQFDCPLRSCVPLADLPRPQTVHSTRCLTTNLTGNSQAKQSKDAQRPKPNTLNSSDLYCSQLSIHKSGRTLRPTSTSAVPATSTATLYNNLLTDTLTRQYSQT